MSARRASRAAYVVGMSVQGTQVDGRAGQQHRDQLQVIGVDKRRVQRKNSGRNGGERLSRSNWDSHTEQRATWHGIDLGSPVAARRASRMLQSPWRCHGHERQDLQISWHAATHSPCQRQTGGFGPERRHSRILSRREAVAGPQVGSTAPSRTGRGRSWRRRECARRKFRSLPSTPDARSAGCCAGCGGRAAMCRRPSEAFKTAVSGVGNPCGFKPRPHSK